MFRTRLVVTATAISLFVIATAVAGDEATSSPGQSTKKLDLPAFTPQREAVSLRFVEQHHPELATVIGRLKSVSREQYEQAVRELFVQADKLTRIKSSDEELYRLMLDAWKLQSRIEVLVARLACAKVADEQQEAALRRLVLKRVESERRIVAHRRKRLQQSVEKADASLKWFDENREQIAERRFQILLRSAQREEKAR